MSLKVTFINSKLRLHIYIHISNLIDFTDIDMYKNEYKKVSSLPIRIIYIE